MSRPFGETTLREFLKNGGDVSPSVSPRDLLYKLLGADYESCRHRSDWRVQFKQTDAAYLAGIIDGEGCIQFARQAGGARRIFPRVLIVNTDLKLLQWISATVGGGDIASLYRPKEKTNWSPTWVWRFAGSRVVELLVAVEPFVRVKSDQILLVHAWAATKVDGRATQEDLAVESFIVENMKWLNQRGAQGRTGADPGTRLLQGGWDTLLPWQLVDDAREELEKNAN
jgi:hypothetical protein